jgi:type IV secretion system protein TrbL
MKRIALFALLMLPSFLFGAISPDNQGQALLQVFADASNQWVTAVKPAAMYLFYSFIVIDFVITFGFLAVKGTEIMEIFGELLRKILWIGFFLMIFQGANMMDKIPASFDRLAFQGSGIDIQPDVILEQAIDLVMKMWSVLDFSIDSLVMVFAGIICLVAFALMAAQLFIVLVKIQALMVGAYLIFAFGGLSYTRSMAINPLKAVFAAGLELMFIKLFMGLTYTTIETMTDNVGNDTTSALMIIIVSVLLVSVVTMIGGMVSSLMSGTLGGNSTSGLAVAAGVAGGAVAGGVAAAKHGAGIHDAVKEAKKKAANGQGSTMGNLGRAIGEDFANTVKGKNARSTTSLGERAAETIRKNK